MSVSEQEIREAIVADEKSPWPESDGGFHADELYSFAKEMVEKKNRRVNAASFRDDTGRWIKVPDGMDMDEAARRLVNDSEDGGDQSDYSQWEIFKALREAYGCSVRDVAERTGVSASYVSEVENGNASASYRYVVRFAEAFDLYRDWLLMRAGHLPSAVARCRPSVADVRDAMHALGYRSEPATHADARSEHIARELRDAVRQMLIHATDQGNYYRVRPDEYDRVDEALRLCDRHEGESDGR